MRLVHFSKHKSIQVKSYEQKFHDSPRAIDGVSDKPKGLWVSDQNSKYNWKWWCEAEGFRLENLKYSHLITLKKDAKILIIDNLRKFNLFHHGYKKSLFSDFHSTYINWNEVAETYQGIIISPYQWDKRMDHSCFWYYGWDCASGCIWNKEAIKSIKLLTNP